QLAPDFDAYLRGLAVFVAVRRKRFAVVREAFEGLGDVPVYGRKTILDFALECGSLRMIKMLVAGGAKLRPDALIEAVRNAAPNTSRFLLAQGIDVNYADPETGFTALMLAASRDAGEVAELLL